MEEKPVRISSHQMKKQGTRPGCPACPCPVGYGPETDEGRETADDRACAVNAII